jgi:hypothetical protein
LEHDNRLVALIVPQIVPTTEHDVEQVEQIIRQEVEQFSRVLPSHHRISDDTVTLDPLPRTRLGKLRRYTLAQRYQQAKRSHGLVMEPGPLPLARWTATFLPWYRPDSDRNLFRSSRSGSPELVKHCHPVSGGRADMPSA